MKTKIYERMLQWKMESDYSIIKGARRIGKSTIVRP